MKQNKVETVAFYVPFPLAMPCTHIFFSYKTSARLLKAHVLYNILQNVYHSPPCNFESLICEPLIGYYLHCPLHSQLLNHLSKSSVFVSSFWWRQEAVESHKIFETHNVLTPHKKPEFLFSTYHLLDGVVCLPNHQQLITTCFLAIVCYFTQNILKERLIHICVSPLAIRCFRVFNALCS